MYIGRQILGADRHQVARPKQVRREPHRQTAAAGQIDAADVADAPKGTFFNGSNEWTQETVEIVAPPEARAVEIRLLLKGKGRAWIKNVMFFS